MVPLDLEYSYDPEKHTSLWGDGRVILALCLIMTALLVFLGSHFKKPEPTPAPTHETPLKQWPATPGHDKG